MTDPALSPNAVTYEADLINELGGAKTEKYLVFITSKIVNVLLDPS